jgi:signal transduction histidine kinase
VGTLRGDPFPGLSRIGELCAAFERASGVPCSARVEGATGDVSIDVQMAVYRTVQEALTNARRHSRAGRVEVRIDCTGPDVAVSVINDGAAGPAAAAPAAGGGHGLEGMRERAELLGGSLTAVRAGDLFEVRATLRR